MSLPKRVIYVLLLTLLGIFLQRSVLAALLPEWLGVPNLVLVITVVFAFYESSHVGAVLAFVCGLLFDMSSGGLLGPWAGSLVLVYFLVAIFAQRLFVDSYLSVAVLFFCAAVVSYLCSMMFSFSELRFESWYLRKLLTEGVMLAIVAPLLFRPVQRLICPHLGKRAL